MQSFTQFEQLATIGRVIGQSLRPEEISPDEARRELSTVIPQILLDAWAAAIGQSAFVTSTFTEITGTQYRRGYPRCSQALVTKCGIGLTVVLFIGQRTLFL